MRPKPQENIQKNRDQNQLYMAGSRIKTSHD